MTSPTLEEVSAAGNNDNQRNRHNHANQRLRNQRNANAQRRRVRDKVREEVEEALRKVSLRKFDENEEISVTKFQIRQYFNKAKSNLTQECSFLFETYKADENEWFDVIFLNRNPPPPLPTTTTSNTNATVKFKFDSNGNLVISKQGHDYVYEIQHKEMKKLIQSLYFYLKEKKSINNNNNNNNELIKDGLEEIGSQAHSLQVRLIKLVDKYIIPVNKMRRKLEEAQYPARLFKMDELLKRASENVTNNANIYFYSSTSTTSRIESYLKAVELLFTSVLEGKRDNKSLREDIRRLARRFGGDGVLKALLETGEEMLKERIK